MPAVMEQISRMSIEERRKLANWILDGIQNGKVANAPKRRVIKRNALLSFKIADEDLFSDDSSIWEASSV